MPNEIRIQPSYPASLSNGWNHIQARNDLEDGMSLSEALAGSMPQSRSEDLSCSAEDILRSGALEGSAAKKEAIAKKTKARRFASYMSLDSKTVSQTKGWRIRSAYRLVSYMARIMEELQGPMTLSQLLHNKYRPDPSDHPFYPANMKGGEVYGMRYVENTIRQMPSVQSHYTLDDGQPTLGAGMTYLPPPVPDDGWPGQTSRTLPTIRRSCVEPVNYDPDNDQLLGLWLDAYDHIATQLRLSDGSELEPESGVFGTVGMFNAQSARMLWPTRDELLIYEMELLLHLFDALCGGVKDSSGQEIGSSGQAVEHYVIRSLGYTRPEAVMLVKTALRYGTSVYQEDFDMNKVRELKALEIIADTSGAGDDPRAQLAARKQLQLVSGLTANDDSTILEDFRDMGAKVLADGDDDFIDV